jgi:hypothetical protein
MPKIAWADMAHRAARSHLIVALLPTDDDDVLQRRTARNLLGLLARLCDNTIQGAYALGVTREADRTALQCAFEQVADAERVAKVLGAARTASSEPWVSVHSLLFDSAAEQRTLSVAGKPRVRRRTVRRGESE